MTLRFESLGNEANQQERVLRVSFLSDVFTIGATPLMSLPATGPVWTTPPNVVAGKASSLNLQVFQKEIRSGGAPGFMPHYAAKLDWLGKE